MLGFSRPCLFPWILTMSYIRRLEMLGREGIMDHGTLAFLTFIQHKSLEIVWNLKISLFSWSDPGINFKDLNWTTWDHLRWIGNKPTGQSSFNIGWMWNTIVCDDSGIIFSLSLSICWQLEWHKLKVVAKGFSVIVSPTVKECPFIRFLRTNSKFRVVGFCKFLSSCKTVPHYDLCDGLLITLQIQW